MRKIYSGLVVLLLFSGPLFSQTRFNGRVSNENHLPLPGAVITITMRDTVIRQTVGNSGDFMLAIQTSFSTADSICFEYGGFMARKMALTDLSSTDTNFIYLRKRSIDLKEVVIQAQNINEEFAVQKISRIEIYNNPNAAADPLKAITFLPYSTTTGETANPGLRGSAPARTNVVLNGVPVRSPVRNTQLSGMGNFSLFNPEMIQSMKVYASNPPLVYGNSTAGLVEMETSRQLNKREIQAAVSLANLGVFANIPLKQKSFLQAYTNYQFSPLFLGVNRSSFRMLHQFGNNDLGLNLRISLTPNSYLNVYNYLIKERYDIDNNIRAFTGNTTGSLLRDFTVVNYLRKEKIGEFSVNIGTDFSKAENAFLNNSVRTKRSIIFASLNYKVNISKTVSLHTGGDHTRVTASFAGYQPLYYYALNKEDPVTNIDTSSRMQYTNLFAYIRLKPDEKWIFSAGVRFDPLFKRHVNDISGQGSIRFAPVKQHSFLLSGGTYLQYSYPTALMMDITSLTSTQLALDYEYAKDDVTLRLAGFIKSEESLDYLDDVKIDRVVKDIKGAEISFSGKFFRRIEVSVANTFLNVRDKYQGNNWRASNDLNYFIKARVTYSNPLVATLSLAYLIRPGTFYTPMTGGEPSELPGVYKPLYGDYNSLQYGTYSTLDFSATKMIVRKKNSFVLFLNVTNLLNRNNQNSDYYSRDYSERYFSSYQQRSLYFGAVIYF